MPTNEDGNRKENPLGGVLGKLVKLTSIRDTELLEQSLLRTLGPLLGVLDTELYRTDGSRGIARVIYSHRSKMVDGDGEFRMIERIEEVSHPDDLPDEVVALTNNVNMLGRHCSRKMGDEVMTAYPLLAGKDLCGYFLFRRDRDPTPAEDTIIRGVLDVFSNYHALLDVSLRDQLTGLLNRQALENNFNHIWGTIGRQDVHLAPGTGRRGAPAHRYWLAVIDIDHFKRVNDGFGHMIGDEVLLICARLMTTTFRAHDLVYRYGGEEFVVIISADNEAIAHNVFERVRLAVEAHEFPQVGHITISIGYAEIRVDQLPVEIIGRADRCLYHAKQNGRNCGFSYEGLLRTGVFSEPVYEDPEFF